MQKNVDPKYVNLKTKRYLRHGHLLHISINFLCD